MKLLFSKEECRDIINFAESKNNWKRINYVTKSFPVKYFLQNINELTFFSERIKEYISSETQFVINDSGVMILKYIEGDMFPRHNDRDTRKEFNSDFLYNINIVLNDDYEGGEFYLNDKPFIGNDVGVVYHYKSTHYHEVKEITKGTRYSALFYLRERDIVSSKINLI